VLNRVVATDFESTSSIVLWSTSGSDGSIRITAACSARVRVSGGGTVRATRTSERDVARHMPGEVCVNGMYSVGAGGAFSLLRKRL